MYSSVGIKNYDLLRMPLNARIATDYLMKSTIES